MDFVVTRNSTGQIIHSEGNIVSMFDWLSSAYLNTTYLKKCLLEPESPLF